MKRLRQLWMKFIERHVVQFDPYAQPPTEPAADVDVLRSSVSRYFRYNQPDAVYIVEYDQLYHTTISILRDEGWKIILEVNASGELFYAIHSYPIKA